LTSLYRWEDLPEEKVNSMISRKFVVGEKEMFLLVTLKKGAIFPKHSHPHEQLTYILKGELRFEVGDREPFVVREGEVVNIPPNVEHSVTALEDTLDLDAYTPIREDLLKGKVNYYSKGH